MFFDLPPEPPKFWLPPKPAIIRQATPDLLVPKREMLNRSRRRAAGGDSTLTTISLVATATSGATNIVWPSLQAGDAAVLLQYAADNYADAYMSGGTSIHYSSPGGGGTTDCTISAACKICTGAEAGSFNGINPGSDGTGKILYIFRGNIPITSITPGSWTSSNANGVPTARTISASGQIAPLIGLGLPGRQGANAAFGTVSPAFDDTLMSAASSGFQVAIAGYKIYNSSPANMSVAGTSGNSSALMAGYLSFA